MYAEGLSVALASARAAYDEKFYPNGHAASPWPDTGIDNWTPYATEAYAEFFAFMSIVDPDPTARKDYAARAKNLLMVAINAAAKGVDLSGTPAPFRGKGFSTYNRANFWGEAFGLTVDWIYPTLSRDEKRTIRKVFLRWADECIHAATAGNEHPQPIGVTNSKALLDDKIQLRWSANNYFATHMRQLTLMSLAFDPADDPPIDPSKPADTLGNSLRSYLSNAVGAWLYQQYAMFETPATVSASLGVPAAGLGLASGGLPVEGAMYGQSIGVLHQSLLALHTAGYDDPSRYGPQVRLAHTALWDRVIQGMLHSITPDTLAPPPSFAYLGALHQMMSYGDILEFWITPDPIVLLGSIGVMDQTTGDPSRLNALRWIAVNALQGGAPKLYERAANVWGNSSATFAILYYLLFDPKASPPFDPRPSLAPTFIDPGIGRVLGHTDFSHQQTWFSYICSWETINHQHGNCNQFELFRKGEFLIKEKSGYTNDFIGNTPDYHNTLAIQNDKPTDLQWFEGATSDRGGQWTNGMNAGDPVVQASSGNGYIYTSADSTNLYNRASSTSPARDVLHASRSIVWLKPDHVIVYDRARTKTANRFKRFHLTLLSMPHIEGRRAVMTTPSGQVLTVSTLLPEHASLKSPAMESWNRVAELEPMQGRLLVEDPSEPTDIRFLHVIEASDAAPTASPALVTSTAGVPFQGALVRGVAVLFPLSANPPFTGTTFVVPKATAVEILTGLTPGAGYSVSSEGAPGGNLRITVVPGGDLRADIGGALSIVTGLPPVALSTPSMSAPREGGPLSVAVLLLSAAPWSATGVCPWVTITSGAPSVGEGFVHFMVGPNDGAARSCSLTIAGLPFTVTQPGR